MPVCAAHYLTSAGILSVQCVLFLGVHVLDVRCWAVRCHRRWRRRSRMRRSSGVFRPRWARPAGPPFSPLSPPLSASSPPHTHAHTRAQLSRTNPLFHSILHVSPLRHSLSPKLYSHTISLHTSLTLYLTRNLSRTLLLSHVIIGKPIGIH
eukprot:2244683-Pleurochrysis_carterae.AAC.1